MGRKPQNLEDALLPIFTGFALIGHGVFRHPGGRRRPVLSVLYAIIFMFLYLAAFHQTIYLFINGKRIDNYDRVVFLVIYTNVVIYFVEVLLSWCHVGTYTRIIQDIAKIDETLKELGASFDYVQTRNEGYVLMTTWIAMSLLMNLVDTLWILNPTSIFQSFLVFSVLHFPAHIITIVAGSFLMDIRHVHLELGEISKDICRSYCIQLTLDLAALFVVFTGSLFLLYGLANDPQAPGYVSRIVSLGVWVVFYFTHFLVMNLMCQSVRAKALKTGQIIQGISQETEDSTLIAEIGQFGLQIIHEPLEFRPGGLVLLGSEFVLKFMGTVTTYVVILIQMNPP